MNLIYTELEKEAEKLNESGEKNEKKLVQIPLLSFTEDIEDFILFWILPEFLDLYAYWNWLIVFCLSFL